MVGRPYCWRGCPNLRPSPLTDREAIWFARRLEDALEELHITRAELGQRLGGKSGQYVSQLLNGATRPSRRRVGEIEYALRLGAGRLLEPPPGDSEAADREWLLRAPLAGLVSSLRGVEGLVNTGRLDAALSVLDAMVERLEALERRSALARPCLVQALLLRARTRVYKLWGGLAVADAQAARDHAERLGAESPELALRAYFWHVYMTHDERGNEALLGVLDRPAPEVPGSAFRYLPLALEALFAPDHESEHRVAARLAQAVRDAPYTPEKAAALHIVQCRVQDDTDWLGLWASEARAAGDTPSLATALYHATLRCFMEGDWRGAYTRLAEGLALAENAGCDRVFEWLASLAAQALRHPMVRYWRERGLDRAWLLREVVAPIEEAVREVRDGARWGIEACASASSALLQCMAVRGDLAGVERLVAQMDRSARGGPPPSAKAMELSWAAAAGEGEARERVWALAVREIRRLRTGEGTVAGLRDVGFVASRILDEQDAAATALTHFCAREPSDAWAWALLAVTRLALRDLGGAAEAAERARDLLARMPEDAAIHPVEFHRLPREKEHRREMARAEIREWVTEVFRAVKAARSLHGPARDRARKALEDLNTEARP